MCKFPIDKRVDGPNEKYQMRRNKYHRRFRAYFVWNFSRYVYGKIREWSPLGVRDPAWKCHIAESADEQQQQQQQPSARFEVRRLSSYEDGIGCHHERDYGLWKSLLSHFHFHSSFFLHPPPSSRARRYFSYSYTPLRHSFVVRCATHIRSVSVPPRSLPTTLTGWKKPPVALKGEPALISHLPLFFISDIRIYHRRGPGTGARLRSRIESYRKGGRYR